LGEYDAAEPHTVAERFGCRHGILADHRVDDEQDLVRPDRVTNRRGLRHHVGVDAEPTRSVDDDDVVTKSAGVLNRVKRNRHRIANAGALWAPRDVALWAPRDIAWFRCEDVNTGLTADDLQLLHGIRPLQVGRNEQRCVALRLEPAPELSGQGRLAGALQPGEHHDGRRGLREIEGTGLAAEDRDEL